jgi:uncharacterized protein
LKLHLSGLSDQNMITGYGDDYVMINQIRYENSLIVLPDHIIENWQAKTFEQMEAGHFECLASFQPEIVLLGTGANLQFPHHTLMQTLSQSGVGIEVMDTHATCRTYNILVDEGRRVAAALLI